jgi:hypothetical protein
MTNLENRYKIKRERFDNYVNTVIFDSKLPWYKVWFCRFIPWMIITPIIGSRWKYFFHAAFLFYFNLANNVFFSIFA